MPIKIVMTSIVKWQKNYLFLFESSRYQIAVIRQGTAKLSDALEIPLTKVLDG